MSDQSWVAGDSPAAAPAANVSFVRVEMVLDNYRVTGDLRQAGVVRRLVDMMNNTDLEFFVMKNGEIDDPFTGSDEPKRMANVEIHRESVLFAFPRSAAAPKHGDAFEVVKKVPVRSTIILPGFEVNGDVHFIPDIDPEDVPMLQNRHFIAMTNASVRASGGRTAEWNEDVVVVNLAQALVFAIDQR